MTRQVRGWRSRHICRSPDLSRVGSPVLGLPAPARYRAIPGDTQHLQLPIPEDMNRPARVVWRSAPAKSSTYSILSVACSQGMTEPRTSLRGFIDGLCGLLNYGTVVSVQHRPQHQQCEPANCQETAHRQRERFEVVAHSPPALCRASAVADSAMILTIVAATAA
jgi:hypothetical protein